MIYVNANVWVPIIDAVNVLVGTNNLADLPDKGVARTNLDVMSTQEVADKIQADILAVKGQPLGLAELDAAGHVPASQLPSYVDDVLEYATYAELPATGEGGKIYVVVVDETLGNDTSVYRWTGTTYAMVSNTLNAADVKSLYESNLNTNEFSDAEKAKLGHIAVTQAVDLDTMESDTTLNNAHRISDGSEHTFIDQAVTTTSTPTFAGVVTEGLVDGRDVSVDGTKLDTIETGATADQTDAEIKTAYENNLDTNAFTDSEKTKLAGVEAGAQVNVATNLTATAGTTAGPTINSSTGTGAVVPSASATASGIVTTGAQTFAGVKTFSSNPLSSAAQSTAVNALTRKDYVDGLITAVNSGVVEW
jgi:hypothetical protein